MENKQHKTKLKSLMIQKGVNRKQLIDKINRDFPSLPVSADAISRIANGQRKNYSISTLLRICKSLNCTPNDIVEYEHLIKADSTRFVKK